VCQPIGPQILQQHGQESKEDIETPHEGAIRAPPHLHELVELSAH
jgi:hypothetical protein